MLFPQDTVPVFKKISCFFIKKEFASKKFIMLDRLHVVKLEPYCCCCQPLMMFLWKKLLLRLKKQTEVDVMLMQEVERVMCLFQVGQLPAAAAAALAAVVELAAVAAFDAGAVGRSAVELDAVVDADCDCAAISR
jgi:hypothetical protein